MDKIFFEVDLFLKKNRVVCFEYFSFKTKKSIEEFNIFTLVSDFYYRENLHSDIIKFLLDPSERHQEGYKFLHLFIDLLNTTITTGSLISKTDFQNSNVYREKSNVDILIVDDISNKAILIENKINNARDKSRQIPRYFTEISENYIVESIVYLTLNSIKIPNESDWTVEERNTIKHLLNIVPAHNSSLTSLYSNWIIPSIIEAENTDSIVVLKHYGRLIKQLSKNTMDFISLEKFYNTIKEGDNLAISVSIKNMLTDLPEYLAFRIKEKYQHHFYPFKSVWIHQRVTTVFEAFEVKTLYLKIDIACSTEGYKVVFWNPKNSLFDMIVDLPIITCHHDFQYYQISKDHVRKFFNFDEENKLFKFLDEMKFQLTRFKEMVE